MKSNSAQKSTYFTDDHEWIDFQGSVAYVGVCQFKLTGFRSIQEVIFNEPYGLKSKGEVIATIVYNDYRIEAHMPVDGKVLQLNEALVSGNRNLLIEEPEKEGWIALIVPSKPYERTGLLLPKQYRLNGKGKYAKS